MLRAQPRHASPIALLLIVTFLGAGLVWYSQTAAFAWDEGFHILIAQLIAHGRKPYLDFVFSQTPLNAFWNAAWMTVFGESWRVPHAVAALCCTAATALTAGFVFSRFPALPWRLPAAILTAILVGLNGLIVRFGGLAQAYGLCLFSIVAAYRLAVVSVARDSIVTAGLAGLFCGIAAGSSLLTAPVGPVILLWILICNRAGNRVFKLAAFLAGEAVAFIPIIWLAIEGPRQVFFGIINYNLLYRQAGWPHAAQQNLEVLLSWIDSGQALLLVLAALGGLLFVYFQSGWDREIKAELYLCAALSCTLFLYISNVRPTFERYYLLTVPFLSILAATGVSAAATRLYRADRPWVPVVLLTLLSAFGLGKALYTERDDTRWTDMEGVAGIVNKVTAPGQTLFADEETYFLSRHTPPSGMEMQDSHKFSFGSPQRALLHVIPQAELDSRVRAGYFHTLETCEDDDYIAAHGYAHLYAKSADVAGCKVFWDFQSQP